MTDTEVGRTLYNRVMEVYEAMDAAIEQGKTRNTEPDLWNSFDRSLELARQMAQENEPIQEVLGEEIAETKEDFAEQVRNAQPYEAVYPEQ